MPSKAAVYARISKDRDGTSLGVTRQQELCERLAQQLGWTVARTYTDNDLSAYSGARRPAYEQLCQDIQAGAVDAVLVADLDRLTRQPAELEGFITLADAHGIALANAAGEYDLRTADGRFMARLLGVVARQESERKSERIKRERAQRFAQGRPSPGMRRFGWEDTQMTTLCETEAQAIRQGAQAVLDGQTYAAVARAWNAQGFRSTTGRTFSGDSVRDILTNPRNAALRPGLTGKGSWPAIFDEQTYFALRDRARAASTPGRPPKYLLSGLLICQCGTPMRSGGPANARVYLCRKWPAHPDACGKVSITMAATDAQITRLVVEALQGLGEPQPAPAMGVESIVARLSALHRAFYIDGSVSAQDYETLRADLQGQIDRAEQAAMQQPRPLDISAEWPGLSLQQRRSIIQELFEAIEISSCRPNAPRRFDASRIAVRWAV